MHAKEIKSDNTGSEVRIKHKWIIEEKSNRGNVETAIV